MKGTVGFEGYLPSPSVTDGVVFVSGVRLYGVPASCTVGCTPAWQSALLGGSQNLSPPVASPDAVFVVAPNGRLYAFAVEGRRP